MVLENFNVKVYNNCVWIFTFKIIKMNVIAIGVSKKKREKRQKEKEKQEEQEPSPAAEMEDGLAIGRSENEKLREF